MTDRATAVTATNRSRPLGRLLRLLLGLGLTAMVALNLLQASPVLLGQSAAVLVGLIGLYSLMHLGVARYLSAIQPVLGTVLALVPAMVIYVLAGPAGELGVVAYIGGSLMLDAATGDSGCEVMALPGLFFKKRTHLCCIMFSPIDWLEERFLRF